MATVGAGDSAGTPDLPAAGGAEAAALPMLAQPANSPAAWADSEAAVGEAAAEQEATASPGRAAWVVSLAVRVLLPACAASAVAAAAAGPVLGALSSSAPASCCWIIAHSTATP